ncbi:unnamed protein product [Ectocarpus fasciculatus]
MACKNIRRLDHRPVDGAALKRQLHRATEAKALASLRETANEEYHRCVEGESVRLERRKSILKAQERQLEDAFQGFRLQKQREMGECIAYAESLKGDDGDGKGLILTPEVAHGFRDAVEDRRQRSEAKNKGSGDVTADERTHDDDRSLKAALRAAVAQEHPEATRSGSSGGSSSSSNYNSDASSGCRDSSGAFSDEVGHDGTDEFSEYSQHGGGAGRSRANSRGRGRETTNTGGQRGDSERRGKGSGGVGRRGGSGVERGQQKHPQAKENRKDGEKPEGNEKVGGGGIMHTVLGTLGFRKARLKARNNNRHSPAASSGKEKGAAVADG